MSKKNIWGGVVISVVLFLVASMLTSGVVSGKSHQMNEFSEVAYKSEIEQPAESRFTEHTDQDKIRRNSSNPKQWMEIGKYFIYEIIVDTPEDEITYEQNITIVDITDDKIDIKTVVEIPFDLLEENVQNHVSYDIHEGKILTQNGETVGNEDQHGSLWVTEDELKKGRVNIGVEEYQIEEKSVSGIEVNPEKNLTYRYNETDHMVEKIENHFIDREGGEI